MQTTNNLPSAPADTVAPTPFLTKKVGYYVYGRTGCTCCSNENFVGGLDLTLDKAIESVKWHISNRTVCSQYSPTGEYSVYQVDYEVLPDGRVIVGDRVLESEDEFHLYGDAANDFAGTGTRIQIEVKA